MFFVTIIVILTIYIIINNINKKDIVYVFIIGILGLYLLCKNNNSNEGFAVDPKSLSDIDAIKNLAAVAKDLQTVNGITLPGSLTIKDNELKLNGLGGAGQLRMIYDKYAAIIRNDGGALYLPLLTNKDNINGSWNDLRPLYIDLASGKIFSNNGQQFSGGTTINGNTIVDGITNIHAGNPYGAKGNMDKGSLTIGDTAKDYGNGAGWNANTAGLLMECKDNTEIAVHDAGTRIASLMSYQGGANKITIGRDMGWGQQKVNINGTNFSVDDDGNVSIKGNVRINGKLIFVDEKNETSEIAGGGSGLAFTKRNNQATRHGFYMTVARDNH